MYIGYQIWRRVLRARGTILMWCLVTSPIWVIFTISASGLNLNFHEVMCSGPDGGEPWSYRRQLVDRRANLQWTSDGQHIVAVTNPFAEIHVVSGHGKKVRSILTGRKNDYNSPDLHPDGSRLVYATYGYKTEYSPGSCHGRDYEIATAALDGSDRQRLTEDLDSNMSPKWSPDGSRIAFAKLLGLSSKFKVGAIYPGDGKFAGVYTMAANGSDKRLVFPPRIAIRPGKGGGWSEWDLNLLAGPVWSGDGKKIAFSKSEFTLQYLDAGAVGDHFVEEVVYVMNSDGSGIVKLFDLEEASKNRGEPPVDVNYDIQYAEILSPLTWSPDDKEIWFLYRLSYGVELSDVTLAAVKVDGSGLREVSKAVPVGVNPSLEWSPDGTKILVSPGDPRYGRSGGNIAPSIYVVNADGSGLRRVIAATIATWSPDGSRIAVFSPYVESPSLKEKYENARAYLFTVAIDGSDSRVLVILDEDGRLKAVNEKCVWWVCW